MTVISARPATSAVGELLREWRQRRRLSQLDLAIEERRPVNMAMSALRRGLNAIT